jgi:superfamily I DNA/RNA helicase
MGDGCCGSLWAERLPGVRDNLVRMTAIRFEREPVRPASAPGPAVELDESQSAVVALADDASAAVLGAPGTGKTTTLVEVVADRVLNRGWSPDEVLVLSSSRIAATRLRDRLALRLGRPSTGPLARTVSSFAFELAGAAARADGAEPPRLVTASELDADIATILEGHIESGTGPHWPQLLDEGVRRLRGFRTELRDLMARATEYDVDPARLRVLGESAGRPEWVAGADFIDDDLRIISTSRRSQLDPAELARFAVAEIGRGRPGDRVSRLRLVLVDDLQETTESTLAIVRALAGRGVAVIAFGDPDVAANAFRGGEPSALGRLGAELGLPGIPSLMLEIAHRQTMPLRAFTASITQRIGTAAAGGQRRARAGGVQSDPEAQVPPLARIEATTPARQWAAVARVLREEHLLRGVPWNRLAVVVRSGGLAPGVARTLALAEVPTRMSGGGVTLRDDAAARALLTIVDVAIGRARLTAELAAELLTGPFGGLDPLTLRRLRLALRAEEVAGGGDRPTGELLVEALSEPGRMVTIDSRPARAASRLAETLAQIRDDGGSIEDLLWIAWDRSRLADVWRDQALGSGVTAVEANRLLDGVVALFSAAKRFAERRPDTPPAEFLAEVLDAEVPEDLLAPARSDDAVLVTTPSGTVGLEFDTVVVAALQDGVWPNLRPRGSLLSAQRLVEALAADAGADAAIDDRKLVLDDELRMFALATSRATSRVILAAVVNDDESPSPFFSLLPSAAGPVTPVIDSATMPPLSLRGVTGRLRRTLVDPRAPRAEAAAAASSLAELARLGLPGASPVDGHGLVPISTAGPLHEGETIPVSPSRIERLEESPLDWFLETIAGGDSGVVAGVGTILHWAMETVDDPQVENLWHAVESRWGELVFEAPWLSARQRALARVFTEGLAEYLADFAQAGSQLVAAEGRFTLGYGELPLFPETSDDDAEPRSPRPAVEVRGSIDRVERAADGSVVIVDLKTGRPITSAAAIAGHPQLGAYQLAYAAGQFDDALDAATAGAPHSGGGAKLLFVREGKDGRRYREGIQAQLDAEGLATVEARILKAATVIAAAEFEGAVELEQFGGFGTTPRLRLHRVRAVSSD